MATTDTLLIEIGTEELPPKALKKLSDAFTREVLSGLQEAQLVAAEQVGVATAFASPRRLGISVPKVVGAQPDQVIERRGPAVNAALNEDGSFTPAASGFARSCGVEVDQLQRLKTDKGEWLSHTLHESGKTISEILPAIIEQSIKRLPIPKRMRWGNGSAEFVRPVHWLIIMHGRTVLPASILGIDSSNITRGHRFHSRGEFTIKDANNYELSLLEEGHVIANFAKRRALIVDQIDQSANSLNAKVETDHALLDEVTGLVEYPTAVLGSFDNDFLKVPQECLVSSMRDHQKYFHIVDQNGELLPNFITISNINSKDSARVQAGNERVLRARLSDARFFWETDQKVKLEQRVDKLDSVLFHIKLGSVLDKTKRIQSLAALIAEHIGADVTISRRGALLAKADLVSDMVGEFDELQGVMGHYYADRDGEDPLVGDCIEQHYWPKFAGDRLPESSEARTVALADRLDSLVGIYAAGEVPTGDKDPYGLRRAALGILRVLIEHKLTLSLPDLVAETATVFQALQDISISESTQTEIVEFLRGRLTAYYQSQDIKTSTINAVMACKPNSPLDFEHRVKAVSAFEALDEATDLAAANKRISNILKKNSVSVPDKVDETLLMEEAEIALNQAIKAIENECVELFNAGDYAEGLKKLAALRSPIDAFFDNVMVMTKDVSQQQNRLALLKRMYKLFMRVADISLLQS